MSRLQPPLDGERRQDAALGVILIRWRGAKQHQGAVIEHALQRPPIALDLLQH